MKTLDDQQVEAFDTVYVNGDRWPAVKTRIEEDFPNGEFRFLDLGGGNGAFADALLEEYPNALGTVLDNSQVLLSRNKPHPRKTLVRESIENLGAVEGKFDLICVHWLLHHLVGNSYQITRRNQLSTLRRLTGLLTERGRMDGSRSSRTWPTAG